MDEPVYRFRSIDALIGTHAELERQEIYFTAAQQLDSSVDGYRDCFWKGDVIVWKNLLRHYALCLMQNISQALDEADGYLLSAKTVPMTMTPDDLDLESRVLFDQLCEQMFADPELKELPDLLERRISPIRRNELLSLFFRIHTRLLNLACAILKPKGLLPLIAPAMKERYDQPLRLMEYFASLNDWDSKNPGEADGVENRMARSVQAIKQVATIHESGSCMQPVERARYAICSIFPDVYLSGLEDLTYGDRYTACFVTDPTRPSMWGHYGGAHRGACLKFKTISLPSGERALRMNRLIEVGDQSDQAKPRYSFSPLPLQEVRYVDRYSEIDFFASLGTMVPRQLAFWFRDANGSLSSIGIDLLSGSVERRTRYWETHQSGAATKLTDWQHEREYRITLQGKSSGPSVGAESILRYRFEDLQGIIFGMKTTVEHKAAIVRIIDAKCSETGRTDFEFYQAFCSPLTGKVEITPWKLTDVRHSQTGDSFFGPSEKGMTTK